jgi:hypothetical protein
MFNPMQQNWPQMIYHTSFILQYYVSHMINWKWFQISTNNAVMLVKDLDTIFVNNL